MSGPRKVEKSEVSSAMLEVCLRDPHLCDVGVGSKESLQEHIVS
jgi:hypothetical protein